MTHETFNERRLPAVGEQVTVRSVNSQSTRDYGAFISYPGEVIGTVKHLDMNPSAPAVCITTPSFIEQYVHPDDLIPEAPKEVGVDAIWQVGEEVTVRGKTSEGERHYGAFHRKNGEITGKVVGYRRYDEVVCDALMVRIPDSELSRGYSQTVHPEDIIKSAPSEVAADA